MAGRGLPQTVHRSPNHRTNRGIPRRQGGASRDRGKRETRCVARDPRASSHGYPPFERRVGLFFCASSFRNIILT